ncbi:glycosyltransferase [Methylophaga thalassica]|uniref:glycosyltransferase n=1 Tax=Methylophaga thalassica TaxID=40223 RepID=UPI002E7B083A|nr:glycosyltransferase [Methylophaga thalassica]WVI86114.1 glycosyltransferase [Methylophaga thalassica]
MELPTVTVLMATFNGIRWIKEQVDSILFQKSVHVHLIISDDGSNDGTYQWLSKLESAHENVTLLSSRGLSLGAAGNFYYLIESLDISSTDYVALADQDDIWYETKLRDQISLLETSCSDGVSSDVIAFWPDGERKRVVKSGRMKKFDYLFESAGPGCTYLFTPCLARLIQNTLKHTHKKDRPELHDWFIYAVVRANHRKWTIAPAVTLEYRQHDQNVMGVNRGWQAKLNRATKIIDGWYRREVIKVCMLVEKATSDREVLELCRIIRTNSIINRLKLIKSTSQARRARVDRMFLYCAFILFAF